MNEDALAIDLFKLVVRRIKKRIDSLRELQNKRFQNVGFETWLKVEALAALKSKVKKIRGNGPDLKLEYKGCCLDIELKAASDLSPSWIKKGIQYKTPCLFMVFMVKCNNVEKLKSYIKIIYSRKIQDKEDNDNKWFVGLAKPKKFRINL